MFFDKTKDQKVEQQIEKNKQLLKELLIRSESLDKEIQLLFEAVQINPSEITEYLSDSNNFTAENWEEINKQRQELREKIKKELDNVPDPEKAKKALKELNVDPRWLFVR